MLTSKAIEKKIGGNRSKGFTLIELMIVVAIIGILAAVVYPSYMEHVTRSNRGEALRELIRFANLQEQLFVDARAYSDDMSDLQESSAAVYSTPSGNYKISSVVVATSFTLTADAQGAQLTNDTNCTSISITDTGSKTPLTCWEL